MRRLYARWPIVCIPLSPRPRAARRRWAAENRDWEQHDWSQVLFTDESRFSLECDTRRSCMGGQGIEITPHSFVKDHNTKELVGWMINARPHRDRLVENMLEAEKQYSAWNGQRALLDLNPIEYVWDMCSDDALQRDQGRLLPSGDWRLHFEEWNSIPKHLNEKKISTLLGKTDVGCFGRQVAGQNYPPINKNTLIRALTDEWDKLPQQVLDNVVQMLHPTKNKSVECGISVDGTWQRRGYSSMNGCVAAVSVDTGKVVDIEIMSSYCPTCRKISKMPRSIESETFAADHVCHSNFQGSALKMEVVGATRILQRSIVKRGLKYAHYYGDGDSRALSVSKILM
ncbi:uncharacterized protein TNCV_1195211 [Trichonephila clavipes]|nr:uncharacterized protein TNCV_1195211 [Trichonephila clavipes]